MIVTRLEVMVDRETQPFIHQLRCEFIEDLRPTLLAKGKHLAHSKQCFIGPPVLDVNHPVLPRPWNLLAGNERHKKCHAAQSTGFRSVAEITPREGRSHEGEKVLP